MDKVINWKKINKYFSEKRLNQIKKVPNDFMKVLLINGKFYTQDNIFKMESFIKLAKKDCFSLSDLRNLNFSESMIDKVAVNRYFTDKEISYVSKLPYEDIKALTIIGRAYAERFDKSGHALAGHSARISDCLKTETERAVGFLHDIVEDGYLTLNNLRQFGFSEEIIEAVDILTRDKNKYPDYKDYINSIISSRNLIALKVKFWDMQDNQSPYRVQDLEESKKEKAVHKYKPFIPLVVLAIKELEEEQNIDKKLKLIA